MFDCVNRQIPPAAPGLCGVTIIGTSEADRQAPPTRIYINNIPEHDWLIALEFGRVDEGQLPDHWVGVSEHFGYLLDDDGRVLGFKALEASKLDLAAPEYEALWTGPQFCAPTLALHSAPAAEVITAARAFYGHRSSVNRRYFAEAIAAAGTDDEIAAWLACIEAGDCMAHYGLGIALMDCDETQRAYKHLRYYASIAPFEAWAQYWYARAALAIDLPLEARRAVGRAITFAADDDLRRAAERLRAELQS
jgi:hypothetical protein